jgi:hypothetical protein
MKRVNSTMVGDRKRFPSGMKALGDYLHSKGLKYGIYRYVEDFYRIYASLLIERSHTLLTIYKTLSSVMWGPIHVGAIQEA